MSNAITEFDAEELARAMLSLSDDVEADDVEQALFHKYDMSFEGFHKLIIDLIPLTIPAKTGVTGTLCQGFVKDGAFIVKVEAKTK